MMKKILSFIITAFLFSWHLGAFAVSITPLRMEINANKAKKNYISTSLHIQGGAEPIRLKVYTGYFKIDTNGSMIFIEKKTNDKFDAQKKIKFLPSEFTIPPGESQEVRINIADVNSLPDGESRGIVFIESVDPKEFAPKNTTGKSLFLQVATRTAIPIYVNKGKFTKHAEIEYFKVFDGEDGKYTELKVNSLGNSIVRYNGKIQILKNKKVISEYPLTTNVAMGGSFVIEKDKLPLNKMMEVGEYTLRAVLSYKNEKNKNKVLKQETTLNLNAVEKESL